MFTIFLIRNEADANGIWLFGDYCITRACPHSSL